MELVLIIVVTLITVAILDWICLCIGLVEVKNKIKGDE